VTKVPNDPAPKPVPGEPRSDTPQTEVSSRAASRAELSTEVRVRRIGGNTYNVRIFDLSPDGAKIEVVERPRIGEQLMLKFDRLETLQAEVCWIDGFVVGLKFAQPLHPAVFDVLVARLR
jgi:hypothetical protein